MKSNKIIFPAFWASLAVLILVSVFLVKPVIIFCVKEQIKKTLSADRVLIGDCHWQFLNEISFDDVQIRRQKVFDITAKEFSLRYNPWLIILGATPNHFIDEIHLSNLALNLKSTNFMIENGTLTISRKRPGVLLIDKIKWGNWIVYKAKSIVRMDKQKLFFKPLTGHLLNGLVEGDVNVTIQQEPEYTARFNVSNIDLTNFVVAFNLTEKAWIQGMLTGNLALSGKGKSLKSLNGDFSSGEQGGSVIIKNSQFLERFAKQSNQSADLLVENLKNYHYNVGDIKLSLDQGVILLGIHLNGDTGKRDFLIRLHKFLE